jgi:biopolymer transport protein ExbD
MRIEAVARRRRPLSLTSLVDVIFLLLLFFMLSSTFTRFATVDVAGGRASADGAAKPPDVLVRLDGESWTVNGLGLGADAAIGEIARLKGAGAERGVLLVRGAVTSQALVSALERIRLESGIEMSVAR